MKRSVLPGLALVALFPIGCAKAPTASNDFDQKWSSLTKGGVGMAVVKSGEEQGNGMLGEVRRAVGSPGMDTQLGAVPSSVFEGQLPDAVAENVVRKNLGGVRGCYALAERQGAGSGKAIVSIDIDATGAVHAVTVEAPAFSSTSLPSCVNAQARAWTFPKFTQGPKHFSYPLVFAGG